MDSTTKSGGDGAQSANTGTSVSYDLGAMLKDNPDFYRILQLHTANLSWLGLVLHATVSLRTFPLRHSIAVSCVEAVDFAIRPPNPALLMGGPLLEFYEEHEMLQKVSQTVPNTDGLKMWDPPIRFGLLKIDQTYVIAQRFELRIEHAVDFKNSVGFSDQQIQNALEANRRALEWMDKFRLAGRVRATRKDLWHA
jgi:hypothetical protein